MAKPAANIRELKARLSQYLRYTKAGEVVEIRERGRTIGYIVPATSSLEDRLEVLIRSGWVRWNRQRLSPRSPIARARGRSVSEVLVEDRQ